jgi:hypothetical protein
MSDIKAERQSPNSVPTPLKKQEPTAAIWKKGGDKSWEVFSGVYFWKVQIMENVSFLKTYRERWCGRWELNPHGPCSPADFLTVYGFRRPDIAGLRSGLSLHLTPKHWRLGAARLVSTPS